MDPQALWLNFRDTITNHYFDMNGRVGRAQFWYFVLVYFVFAIVFSILQTIVWLPLGEIYGLAMLLPGAAMGARRLQDTGRDGRLVWLGLILWAAFLLATMVTTLTFIAAGPLALIFVPGLVLIKLASAVIGLILIWFWIQIGDPGPNAYGPPPPVFDPAVKPAA